MTANETNSSMVRVKPLLWIFAVLALIGLAGLLILFSLRQYERAWQLYLLNFLFWSAIAQGGLLFSTLMHVTKARWSGALQNLSEAFAAFFPVSFFMFLGLYAGKEYLFPWIGQDLHGKEIWLNIPFLFSRDTAGLLLLYGFGLAYVRCSLKFKITPGAGGGMLRRILSRIVGGLPEDTEKCRERMTAFAILYMMTYAVVLSLLSFDLVMSMNPHWISNLFGGYFFVKAFYIGMGALIIMAAIVQMTFEQETLLTPAHFHDIGKLFFGFCIIWAYFLYAQVLVIWYGNIPEETHYLIERFRFTSWKLICIFVFVTAFIIPFFTLINEKAKKKPLLMLILCSLVLTGIWLDNLLLVGPPLYFDTSMLSLRIFDVLVSLGFLGLMALAVSGLLRIFPELFLKTEEKVG